MRVPRVVNRDMERFILTSAVVHPIVLGSLVSWASERSQPLMIPNGLFWGAFAVLVYAAYQATKEGGWSLLLMTGLYFFAGLVIYFLVSGVVQNSPISVDARALMFMVVFVVGLIGWLIYFANLYNRNKLDFRYMP